MTVIKNSSMYNTIKFHALVVNKTQLKTSSMYINYTPFPSDKQVIQWKTISMYFWNWNVLLKFVSTRLLKLSRPEEINFHAYLEGTKVLRNELIA